MAVVKAFRCVRPAPAAAAEVAALPYDVYDRKEAKEAVQGHPLSFLNIDRPETQFPDDFDMYSDAAYEKARELLDREIADGTFLTDPDPAYYVYEQTIEGGPLSGLMKGHVQTGIAACSSVDDYLNGVVKKHENTTEKKEQDRIRHVDTCGAQTGPIFLAYRHNEDLKRITDEAKRGEPLYDFVSEDGIHHRVWKIGDPGKVKQIETIFAGIPATYIADGHHRAASAVKAALKRREAHPDYTGKEEFNFFLSILFPDDELSILPYNRVVSDLAGLSAAEFLQALDESYVICDNGTEAVVPQEKGSAGLYLEGRWYRLREREEQIPEDPVASLDVQFLQDHVLGGILGIDDPRTSDRVRFIGGIRGTAELERLVKNGAAAAFSMYPTQMGELFGVADAGRLMPPKSTWFEPKIRSGIFIHRI